MVLFPMRCDVCVIVSSPVVCILFLCYFRCTQCVWLHLMDLFSSLSYGIGHKSMYLESVWWCVVGSAQDLTLRPTIL